jgi:hypothetical protein
VGEEKQEDGELAPPGFAGALVHARLLSVHELLFLLFI